MDGSTLQAAVPEPGAILLVFIAIRAIALGRIGDARRRASDRVSTRLNQSASLNVAKPIDAH